MHYGQNLRHSGLPRTFVLDLPEPTERPDTGAATARTQDDPAEAAYWEMDARTKGLGEWKGRPQSERDAFKAVFRKYHSA